MPPRVRIWPAVSTPVRLAASGFFFSARWRTAAAGSVDAGSQFRAGEATDWPAVSTPGGVAGFGLFLLARCGGALMRDRIFVLEESGYMPPRVSKNDFCRVHSP